MKMLVWVACINKKQTNREKEQTKFALFCCIGKIEYFDYAIRKKKDIINRP